VLLPIVLFFDSYGQVNLVANPGFETMVHCPSGGAQWDKCQGWNNINLQTGIGPWATPDYFNLCGTNGTKPPFTFAGTCMPQTGNAMMALVLYNVPYPEFREYLSTQLIAPMYPGVTYTLSFWITNGQDVISPWTIRNIGVHFSNAALTQTGWNRINVIPQCEITTNVSGNSWTQYTFTVNPTNTWNFLSIGAFRTDSLNQPVQFYASPPGNAFSYANYFIDEVEVLAPKEIMESIMPLEEAQSFNLYPNPCSAPGLTVELRDIENIKEVYLTNSLGETIYAGDKVSFEKANLKLNIAGLQTGIYILNIRKADKLITCRFIRN
jgi:hypothetical protein